MLCPGCEAEPPAIGRVLCHNCLDALMADLHSHENPYDKAEREKREKRYAKRKPIFRPQRSRVHA